MVPKRGEQPQKFKFYSDKWHASSTFLPMDHLVFSAQEQLLPPKANEKPPWPLSSVYTTGGQDPTALPSYELVPLGG